MMAHGGSTSRHGRYDAFRKELPTDPAADELPSHSVFSYDGAEDVKRPRDNPSVGRQRSAHRRTMTTHGVVPSGPVVALHMFDVPSDRTESEDASSQPSQLRRWSRESLSDGDGLPPRPPSTPRSQRPGSARRRTQSGERPTSSLGQGQGQGLRQPSARSQRPGSARRSSADSMFDQEESLPPVSVLRPQSSLGRYAVLPSISPTHQHESIDGYLDDVMATGDTVATHHHGGVTATGGYHSDTAGYHGDYTATGFVPRGGKAEIHRLSSKFSSQSIEDDSRRGQTREPELSDKPTDRSSVGDKDRQRLDREKDRTEDRQRNIGQTSLSTMNSQDTSIPNQSVSGNAQDILKVRHSTPSPSISSGSEGSSVSAERSALTLDRSHTSIANYKMEEAAKPPKDDQVLIGIKIPTDGTRHKQYFNQRDQLRCIIVYAEEVSGEDFSNHILVLATNRKRLENLSQTIQDAGLESKSVVHLEELDD